MSDEEPKTTTAVEEKTTGDKRKAEDAEEVPVADESTKKQKVDLAEENKANPEEEPKSTTEDPVVPAPSAADADAAAEPEKEDEVQVDVDPSNIIEGKRRRAKVDYSSAEALEKVADIPDEDEDDKDADLPVSAGDDDDEEAEEEEEEDEE
ncbi:hypothetical protein NCC49_001037 [Naganishia albida]|nr:hypothetical protein NCC49_001037 [Naganishia albida]